VDEGLCHDSMVEVTRSRPPGFRPFALMLHVPETHTQANFNAIDLENVI
jgi:hypothetical protein